MLIEPNKGHYGNLDETRGNVLRLLKMKTEAKSHLKLVVSYVEQPQNTAETKDFESYWTDQGADFVVQGDVPDAFF